MVSVLIFHNHAFLTVSVNALSSIVDLKVDMVITSNVIIRRYGGWMFIIVLKVVENFGINDQCTGFFFRHIDL